MTHAQPPGILQMFRERVKVGCEIEYGTIERDSARLSAELGCPHPHLAAESLSGPMEVWWLNAFESDAHREQVERAYAQNHALIQALRRNSSRKAALAPTTENVYGRYRSDLSRGPAWTLSGARFLAVGKWGREEFPDGNRRGKSSRPREGSVFEAPGGLLYVVQPLARLEPTESSAAPLPDARLFGVRPFWGFPAKEWIEADPEFWAVSPATSTY